MPRIAVVTDSAANLPPALREGRTLTVIPVTLQLDGRVLRDEIDITAVEFYRWFAANPDAPLTTSCPSPGEFLAAYLQVSAGVDGIVSVHIAGGLSGTIASAARAADMLRQADPESPPVEIVDTGSASMACGFCVLAAEQAARQGMGLQEVAEAARAVARQVRMYAVLGTLRYVMRSGRVPSVARLAGSLLPLHALLKIGEGKAGLAHVDRTEKRALRRLVETTLRESSGSLLHLCVLHAAAEERAQQLARTLSAEGCCAEPPILVEFTPVMGAHTGPGLLGVTFYPHEGDQ